MPYTMNGAGTHYYGKKNLEKKHGVCEKCHREVVLESYETRLWFVILFSISKAWYNRLTFDTVYLLNIGGGAVFIRAETLYSDTPVTNVKTPYKLFVGNRFLALHGIDYKFVDFPETIEVEHGKSTRKTQVGILRKNPLAMLDILLGENIPFKDTLAYLETNLNVKPNNGRLVNAYAGICIRSNKTDRCYHFLENGLNRRPVSIMWHRMYQHIGVDNS